MAIDDLSEKPRLLVAWFDTSVSPSIEQQFKDRGLVAKPCTAADLLDDDYLAGVAAVVFVQKRDKSTKVGHDLQRFSIRLLDWDCRMFVASASDPLARAFVPALNSLRVPVSGLPLEAEPLLKQAPTLSGDPPLPHIRVVGPGVPWSDIANFVIAHRPGRPPSKTLKLDGPGVAGLCPEHELMLRRAFWDCANVHLAVDPQETGKSGATVYRVHAELNVGQWPLPYFVKLGRRDRIYTEYVNYEQRVRHYVPFHLGPHLIRDRCHLGAKLGVIVGDWVDESESLRQCASAGRGAASLACLFDRTLLGWHRSAQKEARPLREWVPCPKVVPRRRVELARTFGKVLDPAGLRRLYDFGAGRGEVYIGSIHGDLHAKNVRARSGDAIVIDFFASKSGPIIMDAASLEASLLIDGFVGDPRSASDWLKSVECLYNSDPLLRAPTHQHRKDPSNWFHTSVRQIRLYGAQMEVEPKQYAAALAVALLGKAKKDDSLRGIEDERRAIAYLFASRVLSIAFETQDRAVPEPASKAS